MKEENDDFLATNVIPYPITITHGKGAYLYDKTGKQYLDMASGIAVTSFGHQPTTLLKALNEQAQKLAILPRLYHNEPLTKLASQVCKLTGLDKMLPMNSGAEAVETAIKTTRKWAYSKKQVKAQQAEIIVCQNAFHGRTTTVISMAANQHTKDCFGPLTPGFKTIPFNDPKALNSAITENTAAFIVEPIQGEAGVIIPDQGYLQQCAEICKQHNVMLICDEIQSGMGRTGKFLASQYDAVIPDGVLLGKALGGGLLPISAFVAKAELMDVLQPGDHGSTFGGNPLACHVASQAIELLFAEDYLTKATKLGEYCLAELARIDHPFIKTVRGKGLLMVLEINTELVDTQQVYQALMSAGLLTIKTHHHALRLLPPLTISKAQIDEGVALIKQALTQLQP